MKKIIAAAFLSIILLSVNVNASMDLARIGITNKTCEKTASLAEQIMTHRQNNGDMLELTKAVQKSTKNKYALRLTLAMIREAYALPRFSVEENKKEAIQDFKNANYLECVEAIANF